MAAELAGSALTAYFAAVPANAWQSTNITDSGRLLRRSPRSAIPANGFER